jgi:hypothetical protein
MGCDCGWQCRATDPECEGTQLRGETVGGCMVPFVLFVGSVASALIWLSELFV